MRITAPEGASEWSTFSGVDFVFNQPLTPDCIVEVSYEMSGEGHGAVFFNNLSDANAALSNVNSIGAGWWDGGFQFLVAKDDRSADSGCWVWRANTAGIKAVYNLYNWTYDGAVTIGETTQVTARSIGPGAYNTNDENWNPTATFVCTPGSTFDRLTFAVRQGTSTFDNISVKAYKIKSDIAPQMTETFTGKIAGAVAGTKVEEGFGSWVANTVLGSGFEYVEYTNAAGTSDIGVRASGSGNRLQYVPGMNFSKLYENNNSEITVGFDFITPDANPGGWVLMEWGDGFTNKYRNIPFFAIIGYGDRYKFTRCSRDVNGTSEDFGDSFAWLDKNQVYTFEAKIYPATEMTYATIKQGENVIYSGFYRMGQWRQWTEEHNIHTMSITEMWNTGIVFDNFKMSARAFSVESQLGKIIDFNEFSNNGFLETIYWGAAKIASAPSNGETDMGNALNVVGDSEGVALPYFAEPVTEGVYRYTAMLYNNNLDVANDESDGKKDSRARVMIDAPKDASGFAGSLTLALLEDNTVSLGKEDKIAVAPNEWIGVETIIDLNNKKTYLAVYDKDGHKLGIVSSEFFANDGEHVIDSINSIRIRNWNSTASGIASVIDDMKLEAFSGSVGFTKDGKTVTSLAENDVLKVGFPLLDMPVTDSSESLIVAFYDAQDRLLSASVKTIPVKAGYGFCVSNDTVTVPSGAVSAKAFVWHLEDIKPIAQSVATPEK